MGVGRRDPGIGEAGTRRRRRTIASRPRDRGCVSRAPDSPARWLSAHPDRSTGPRSIACQRRPRGARCRRQGRRTVWSSGGRVGPVVESGKDPAARVPVRQARSRSRQVSAICATSFSTAPSVPCWKPNASERHRQRWSFTPSPTPMLDSATTPRSWLVSVHPPLPLAQRPGSRHRGPSECSPPGFPTPSLRSHQRTRRASNTRHDRGAEHTTVTRLRSQRTRTPFAPRRPWSRRPRRRQAST